MVRLLSVGGRWIKKGLRGFGRIYKFTAVTLFSVVVLAVLIEVAVRMGAAVYQDLSRKSTPRTVSRPVMARKKPPAVAPKPVARTTAPSPQSASRTTPPAAPAPRKTPARNVRPEPSVTNRAQLIQRFHLTAYVRESRRVQRRMYQFRPYVVWQPPPFKGRAINIGPDGRRRTLGNSTRPDARRIFVMGGSTVWGAYVADADTFPSHLARVLNRKVGPFKVYNFGQNAYSSTQALIRLMLELRQGNVPDAVIFLNGVNDGFIAACYPAVPGSIYPLYSFFERLSAGAPWRAILRDVYKNSDAVQLLVRAGVLGKVIFPDREPQLALAGLKVSDKIRVAAEMYRRNVAMAEALAQRFKFQVFFFWQPALYTGRKPLAPFERYLVFRERLKNDYAYLAFKYVPLFYREIKARPPRSDHFFDLSGMFQDHRELLFGDYVHLLAPGNRLLAERVVEIISPRLVPELGRPLKPQKAP
jgi:lysophospholipase L1-like esterase